MDHAQITKALARAGHNWTTAAAAIGKSRAAVSRVCNREIKSRTIALGVCALLDAQPAEIFPDVPEYAQPTPAEMRARRISEGRKKVEAALGRRVA
ncbi:hypothetical protein [Thiohalomonas denitrificans]|uniref:hypothetical protein n=1 Tax=Thiohalomonas denitrificans TaxID=415747 RepID=UPI0026F20E2B|nr:hypothetical protein [Thiohalomonas denitrificans]